MANTLKFGNGEWAVKEGSALAYNDENGNFKPLPFDFTRASTATYVAKDGLIKTAASGEPRIDFLNDSEGSLKLEPQRTNLITYSSDFSQWSKQSSGTGIEPVVTSNNITSPDGTLNADKVVFNKGAGVSTSDLSILTTSFTSQSNTASVYIKADSAQRIVIRNSGTWVGYDIGTEWTKIKKTDTGGSLQIGLRDGYGIANVPNTATVYLWGAQVEAGSYATSYIPTSGTTVTRNQDTCSQTGLSNVIGQTEGTMFFEGVIYGENSSVNRRIFTISNGTTSTGISIQTPAINSKIEFEVTDGGVAQAFISADNNSLVYGQKFKAAFAYKSNDFAAYINGVQIGTDTSGSVPVCDKLSFDRGNDTSNFEGSANQAQLYKTRLTNTELATLTTI